MLLRIWDRRSSRSRARRHQPASRGGLAARGRGRPSPVLWGEIQAELLREVFPRRGDVVQNSRSGRSSRGSGRSGTPKRVSHRPSVMARAVFSVVAAATNGRDHQGERPCDPRRRGALSTFLRKERATVDRAIMLSAGGPPRFTMIGSTTINERRSEARPSESRAACAAPITRKVRC
jgi:hypothetical protein